MLEKQEEFLRHVTAKMLGYALGRSLLDEDQCTAQRIVDKLEASGHPARMLVTEVVLSPQFRFKQAPPLTTAANISASGSAP